jgi:hypothetical protein
MSIYAVNGKIPVAAWIPSLDTVGNGTSTLRDLVGTNHGTLTNMDAATDWVADTGAGGVRALDFDGSNDTIVVPRNMGGITVFTFSCWASSSSSQCALFSHSQSGQFTNDILFAWTGGNLFAQVNNGADGNGQVAYTPSATWRHFVMVYNGAGANNSERLSIYLNGAQQSLTYTVTIPASAGSPASPTFNLNGYTASPPGWFLAGRMDDFRLWHVPLNASDVSQLYRNGNGRGVTANSNTFPLGMPI